MNSRIVFVTRDTKDSGFSVTASGDCDEIERKNMCGVGKPLPHGMLAGYTVWRFEDGSERVEGSLMARSKHGKRYFTDDSESAVQDRLIKWSNRILRERKA
jgi:hypothetical protein